MLARRVIGASSLSADPSGDQTIADRAVRAQTQPEPRHDRAAGQNRRDRLAQQRIRRCGRPERGQVEHDIINRRDEQPIDHVQARDDQPAGEGDGQKNSNKHHSMVRAGAER